MSWRSRTNPGILVAASNSAAKDRNVADYVCDGSNDGTQIRAAIRAASAGSMWAHQEVFASGTFASVIKISESEYHMYYHNISPENIHHATSVDGITWVDDTANNPIFPRVAETAMGVPNVWIEAGTWYMLYRYTAGGVQSIGLATSPDGLVWTRSASNPVLSKEVGETGPFDSFSIIKVGSIYYMYYNASLEYGTDRFTNYATSTNLTTWTKGSGYILRNGSFCPTVFKVGSIYYMIITRYIGYLSMAVLALYMSRSPTFAQKSFVGVIKTQSDSGYDVDSLDCPFMVCDDVTKTLLPTDPVMCYFSANTSGTWTTGLMQETSIDNALKKASLWGSVKLLAGKYTVGENNVIIDAPMTFDASEATLVSVSHETGKTPIIVGSDRVTCRLGVLESSDANALSWTGNNGFLSGVLLGFVYVYGSENNIDVITGTKYVMLIGSERCNVRCCNVSSEFGVFIRNFSLNNVIVLDSKNVQTGVHVIAKSSRNVISGKINVTSKIAHFETTSFNNVIKDAILSGVGTAIITDLGSGNKIIDNDGLIGRGEIRSASGLLIAGNADAIAFAWHNPELQDILIKKVTIRITTPGGTAGSLLDVGIADDAAGTGLGAEFFNDLDLNTAGISDQDITPVFCQDSVSATDGWVVGKILVQNAASLVGSYYIEYMGA